MAARCISCMRMIAQTTCPHCGYPAVTKNESHHLPVGTMLRGRYQIGKVLGQGGFGITYLAWDKLMRTSVAVKEFYPGGTVFRRSTVSTRVECVTEGLVPHYEYSRERFLREASALVDFRDIPEVVGIQDFVEENNTAYIVMEYVKGVDLAKYIQHRGGKLSVDETFRILKPVMEALAKVHKGGIVHRDISPDNIILDPVGGAKLLDFGAVRSVENPDVEKGLTKSTEAILKHGFAPLEQYNSRGSLGPWTDEYAMCATIWYCLTGRVPEEASIRVMEGTDPDWSSIPGLPIHQQKALEKGISSRAKDRYPSMDELIFALFVNVTNNNVNAPIPVASAQTVIVSPAIALPSVSHVATYAPSTSQAYTSIIPAANFPLQKSHIAAGYYHTLGLKSDGTVIATGSNKTGRCQVSSWTNVVSIAVGTSHSVGLRSDKTVIATGDNLYGQCNVSSWREIVSISASGYHTVGLRADGRVVAVGNNNSGQCNVSKWDRVIAIYTGAHQTVGIRADGSILFTGNDRSNMSAITSWTGMTSFAVGKTHIAGISTDGLIRSIGCDKVGIQFDSNWTNISSISSEADTIVAVKRDGSVVAGGNNYHGQCDVNSWRDIIAVSAGVQHTIGLRADGSVVATGWNENDQCSVSDWKLF